MAVMLDENKCPMSQDDSDVHDSDGSDRDDTLYQMPQPYGGLFTAVTQHSGPSSIEKYATGKLDVQTYILSSFKGLLLQSI